jgi:Flp pilus assembly protein TadG
MRFIGRKSRSQNPRRCGSVLIYSFFLMTIMFAMISLAVDFGHMQTVKTELQRCADATSRGCMMNYLLYGSSTAQSYATTLAGYNTVDAKSGVSPTVTVTWGWWNAATKSFVAGSGSPVAVQTVVSRTTANGNTIPLTFPLMNGLGPTRTSCDVWASSVASSATQTLVNFPSGFASASSSLALNGSAFISGTHIRLTTSSGGLAGTAYYANPIPVGTFSSTFSFQLTNPNADGMTFLLQNSGKTAVGNAGGDLGFGGIGHSVCIKFDLYNNAGEGVNSTGFFSGGVDPFTPATDMTSTGINLHSGHVFNVSVTYNGTALSWTVTDATTAATGTFSAAANIPALIGSSTAYVGFSGGTGGLTAQQDVLSWTLSATGPVLMK